jgi:tripartite ATP-independent transporter DctM subunit
VTLVVSVILLILFLLFSVPVAATLAVLGLLVGGVFSQFPLYKAIGEISWSAGTDFILLAIPLYVLLGEILLRGGIAERTYRALDRWLSWLPGGLMHANIGTCAMFSATSGSSVATAATITTVALPQARKYGYAESLFAGSIAAGGTLGILIPPSINLIVYGFLTNTSVPRLFVAGIVPGVLLAVLFMIGILVICLLRPETGSDRRSATWGERIDGLKDLLPVVFIFIIVVGSIYAGFATPTESAALGVIAALFLALVVYRTVNRHVVREILEGTMRTTAMIMLILTAAYYLNFVIASIGLSEKLTDFLNNLGMTPLKALFVIVGVYVVLGFFIETLSLMVITIPIVAPVVQDLGFDLIWFGVLLILLIEMALITPPVGLNLYVVQGVRNRGSISEVMIGSVPFVVLIAVMIGVLIAFPNLTLFLTRYMH